MCQKGEKQTERDREPPLFWRRNQYVKTWKFFVWTDLKEEGCGFVGVIVYG